FSYVIRLRPRGAATALSLSEKSLPRAHAGLSGHQYRQSHCGWHGQDADCCEVCPRPAGGWTARCYPEPRLQKCTAQAKLAELASQRPRSSPGCLRWQVIAARLVDRG